MMHPAMLQEFAAGRVKDMIATGDKARRAQPARRARRWRTSVSAAARLAAHFVETRTTVSTRADRDRLDSVTGTSDNSKLSVPAGLTGGRPAPW
jgi:hypothetical protein